MKAYLAGPIFFYGDYLRNIEWAKKIRDAFPGIDLYSPVENTEINGVDGKKKFADSKMIADADNARLDQSDVLFCCIDGDVLPSGTCAEIGKFHEKIARGDNKIIIGICTDTRQCYITHSEAKDIGGRSALGEQQYSYQNIYVTGLIKSAGVLVSNIEDAIEALKTWQDYYYYEPTTDVTITAYDVEDGQCEFIGTLAEAEKFTLNGDMALIMNAATHEAPAYGYIWSTTKYYKFPAEKNIWRHR